MIEEGRPIFMQIAEQLADDIISGTYPEESQVPSTNEFAAFHRINPATAAKGVAVLVDDGVLYKRRGIGMFVAAGARAHLLEQRTGTFTDDYVRPLVREATALGLKSTDVIEMIRKDME